MGIPSYFFQLMKRHKQVISQYNSTIKVDNLYLDSNSIIYDVVHSMTDSLSKHEFEEEVISRVCLKLLSYLQMIQPSRVFIAFDGVPPKAKMKQQRERRYKGWLTSQWLNEKKLWDTVQITPGTAFMKRLDQQLVQFFEPYRSQYIEFYLSTSSEIGEGEHKLFNFIRDHPDKHREQHTMIYGLDSDLIILSLNHLSICQHISLLREAPAFNVKEKEKKNQLNTLDINQLSDCITEIIGKDRLQDYIFMTLLLGNDFMPHFPALNLRTTGMDTLLHTYVECMQDKPMFQCEIQWDNVRHFISSLANKEHTLFMEEHASRNKRIVDNTTLEKRVNNLPMLKREKEYIICPTKTDWQKRYYEELFQPNIVIEEVCTNYVQMMDWNMRYYTSGCTNWTLYYHYAYPPLLEDLTKHIPLSQQIVEDKTVLSSDELLEYVLPPALMFYADKPTFTTKIKEPKLVWSYCTYLWEAHVEY
jgi:5'-3' exoribonuclease 1